MDIYLVRFTLFTKPQGVTLAYSRVLPFSSTGYSDRGPLTAGFKSTTELVAKLEEVGLPVKIAACNEHPTENYSVTEEQLAQLGFTGKPY